MSRLARRWPWAVVAGAAGLAFIGGIGAGLAPPAPTPSSTAQPAVSPTPHVPRTPVPNALAQLARPQGPDDIPAIPVGHRLRPSTFRVIDSSVLSNIYVARDVDGRVCVVALPIDDQFSAACAADPKGLRTPLLLYYTVIPPGQGPVEALAGVDATG